MKLLAAYLFTHARLERFNQTLQLQNCFGWDDRWTKVHFTDAECGVGMPFMKVPNLYHQDPPEFNYSAGVNAYFRYAIDNNYDWLIMCDADIAIARFPTVFPENGWARQMTFFEREENARPNHLFLVRADVAHQLPWDETYGQYGCDMDWFYKATARFGEDRGTDSLLIHRWHERGGTPRCAQDDARWKKVKEDCAKSLSSQQG